MEWNSFFVGRYYRKIRNVMERHMKTIDSLIESIKQELPNTQELNIHEFEYFKKRIVFVYLASVSDEEKIKKEVIQPLVLCEDEKEFKLHLLSLPKSRLASDSENLPQLLIEGNLVLCLAHTIFLVPVQKDLNLQITSATVEIAIQGPQNALTEDMNTNILLIRKRYPSLGLKIEDQQVGTLSKTPLAIIYDREYVEKEVLEEVKSRLSRIDTDIIQAVGQLQNMMTKEKRTLFPTMMITERPDRIAFNLAQGKVVVLLDGTPFVLIAPAVFFDFLSAMDDLYQSYWVAKLMVIIRYIGLIITTSLPAFYIAVTSYNPEILRSQLALTIAGSRAAVPYPSFIEVLIMLLAVEMLVEASVRLPKAIGPTATTVGGLILGQAAQQAQLVSSIMIIITAFVAIANFSIPINSMSFSMRMVRYPLVLLATFFGLIGVIVGLLLFITLLVDQRSFGKPYLAIYWGTSARIKRIMNGIKEEKN
jgi:hypothetical protein